MCNSEFSAVADYIAFALQCCQDRFRRQFSDSPSVSQPLPQEQKNIQQFARCNEQPAISRCSFKSRFLNAVNEIFRIARSIRDNFGGQKSFYIASECSHKKLRIFVVFPFVEPRLIFLSLCKLFFGVMILRRERVVWEKIGDKSFVAILSFRETFSAYSFNVLLVTTIFTCFWY